MDDNLDRQCTAPTQFFRETRNMELINRGIQRQILTRLGDEYPHAMPLRKLSDDLGLPSNAINANSHYLNENKLIVLIKDPSYQSIANHPAEHAALTAAGIDFLSDDGGLQAILGVVTIRLHEDTIKALIANKIEASNQGDVSARKELADKVRSLPAKVLEKVVERILDAGMNNMPGLLDAITRAL